MTYSSTLVAGRQRFAGKSQNSVSFKRDRRGLGPISNSVVLIVMACLLGLLYLTQVTKTNAHGYKINELLGRQSQLKSEHDELEVASARLQALDRVASSEAAAGLVSLTPSATVQN